jgi:riboflavin kinase/FMN adenylyltransferase
MKVFEGFEHLTTIPNAVLTIGTFDGVHLGHQKILNRLNEEAQKIGGESVLFTFYPHPRMVLSPTNHGLKLLQTQNEKIDKLSRMGLQNMIVHPFTEDFASLTATEFVRDFLVGQLKVKKLVIGYDHQFGKNREGSLAFLQKVAPEYGFEVIEISAKEIEEVNVSSTKIRNALAEGQIEIANQYLGESFQLTGKVVFGNQLGRTIGYPTANIDVENTVKIIPAHGVYAVEVVLPDGQETFGMMNIGNRPTINSDKNSVLEVHVFDFKEDIYGKQLTVRLFSKLRNELRFENLEELQTQLEQDEKDIRAYFSTSLR